MSASFSATWSSISVRRRDTSSPTRSPRGSWRIVRRSANGRRKQPISDADCGRIVELDVSDIEPLVAVPHDLSDVRRASDLSEVRIDEAIFGTCTGGRIEDFRIAASMLEGKKLAANTRMMVNPGSREVYLQAMREGLIDIMVKAGATVGVPGCGPCSGCHQGMLAPTENAITNASRNFKGRFGSPEANAYVASSATVVASAIAGRIASPTDLITQ